MSGFTHLGKQVLADGEHYADAADPTAAAFIAEACTAKAGGGRQPIDTAPRDVVVDLWVVDRISGLEWREPDAELGNDGWRTLDVDRGYERVGYEGIQVPTHWRPLSAPPESNPQAEAAA